MKPLTLIAIVRHGYHVIGKQQALIRDLVDQLDEQERLINELNLEAIREMEGIVSAWMLHLEQPEIDLRDDLARLQAKLSDQIARTEEHVL